MKFIINVYKRIKEIILRPESFFKKNKDGIEEISKFLLVMLIVPAVTSIIRQAYLSYQLSILEGYLPLEITTIVQYQLSNFSIITAINEYFLSIILYIIITLITHFLWRVFGGRGLLEDSLRAVIYGSTPYLLFGWVPLGGTLIFLYSFYLIILGGAINHKISKLRSLIAIIIIPAIITVLFLLNMARLPFIYSQIMQISSALNESLINESLFYY